MNKKLYFDSIREKREIYFVEYHPPLHEFLFATLKVTYVTDTKLEQIVADLEKEAKIWVERYPVSLMVMAFDEHGDSITLKRLGKQDFLIALKSQDSFSLSWETVPDSAFPQETLDSEFLLSVYSDIPFRTQDEVIESATKSFSSKHKLKLIILIWAVFVPALIAILEFFSPTWVAVIALLYSLWQAYQKFLIMTGRKPRSEVEIEKEKEELKMRHHHYHCEKNPDGFVRLKIENAKTEAKTRINDEFNKLQ